MSGMVLNFINAIKQVMVQPVISNGSVISFNIRVLLRVTWLDKGQFYASAHGPSC